MCLIDRKRFRFTIFPKKVYKLVREEGGKKYSPIIRDNLITSVMEGDKRIGPYREGSNFIFESGFIYAFSDKEFAYKLKECMSLKYPTEKYTIVEGYIPSFTRYAIDHHEICARKMILNI